VYLSHLWNAVCNSFLDAMDVWPTASLGVLLSMLLLPPISLMNHSSSAEVCSFVDSSKFLNVIGSHLHIIEILRYFQCRWYLCDTSALCWKWHLGYKLVCCRGYIPFVVSVCRTETMFQRAIFLTILRSHLDITCLYYILSSLFNVDVNYNYI
jgi:hypothetical protein